MTGVKDCIKAVTPLVAIIGLVLIEIKALSMGIDGTLMLVVGAIVGGLGGYEGKVIKDILTKVKQ